MYPFSWRHKCLESSENLLDFYFTKRVKEFIVLRQYEKMTEGNFQTFLTVFDKISWLKILLEFEITNKKNL